MKIRRDLLDQQQAIFVIANGAIFCELNLLVDDDCAHD